MVESGTIDEESRATFHDISSDPPLKFSLVRRLERFRRATYLGKKDKAKQVNANSQQHINAQKTH